MEWAIESAHIARAFAGLAAVLDRPDHLSLQVRQRVVGVVEQWTGEDQGLSAAWVTPYITDLPEQEQPAARLALLTALAPFQISDDVVRAARSSLPTDHALVAAIAWSAFLAARRVGSWAGSPDRLRANQAPVLSPSG